MMDPAQQATLYTCTVSSTLICLMKRRNGSILSVLNKRSTLICLIKRRKAQKRKHPQCAK